MSSDRSIALVLVGILLTGAMFGSVVAVAGDRTVFDGEYVSQTFEDEGVYAEVATEVRSDVADDIGEIIRGETVPQGIQLDLDSDEIAAETITESFVATEMDRSIREFYAYLHGDRADLDIRFDLTTQREIAADAITDGITIDTPTLVGSNSDHLDNERIAMLSAGPSEYEAAQMELSSAERNEIESDLEANVRIELDGENENLTNAVLDHQRTVLDGLTGELSHEEYVTQLEDDEQRIKAAIADNALADVPADVALFGEDETPEDEFAPFATATQLVSTLAWALPIIAVVLVGLGYGIVRDVDRTAAMTGGALFWAGLVGTIVGILLRPTMVGIFEPNDGGDSDPMVDGLVAVVDGSLWTVGILSAVLLGVGIVLLAGVFANRRGVFEGIRSTEGIEAEGTNDDAAQSGNEKSEAEIHSDSPGSGEALDAQTGADNAESDERTDALERKGQP